MIIEKIEVIVVNSRIITMVAIVSICLFMSVYVAGCKDNQGLDCKEMALHDKSLKDFVHPSRWEETIEKFKEQDIKNPPPQNATLFVGSSSIVRWNTKKWFPDIENINRGFGGSQINDSWYYAESIIIPYNPKTIVFYAGDNDTADGKTPEMLLVNFKAFAIKVRKALPETRLIYVSIKPSIARWSIWPQMQKANELISNYSKKQKNMYFVDVSKVMLDSSGKPIKEIFSPDGLHMNEKGYELWASLVRPLIDK
jgi:GDSL-like Lipase/Acylhydrolase family